MVTFNVGPRARGRRASLVVSLLVSIPFFVIGMLLGYFLVFLPLHARWSGLQTQGTVISTSVCSSDGGDVVLRPFLAQDSGNSVTAVIQFTDIHGQKQEVSESTCGDYTEGQRVTLWYLPSDPQTFATDQQLSSVYWIAGITAIFAAPFVISLLIIVVRMLFWLVLLLFVAGRRTNQPQPAFATPVFQPQPYNPAYGAPAYGSPYSPTIPALVPPQLAPITNRPSFRLGQTAEIDGLCAVTLTRVATSSGDMRTHPATGYVYLLLGVALRNRSAQPVDAFMVGRFQLAEAQGNEYQPALLAGTVFYLTGMIQPGDQQDEQLAFSVPLNVHQFHLAFQRDRSGSALATWQIEI